MLAFLFPFIAVPIFWVSFLSTPTVYAQTTTDPLVRSEVVEARRFLRSMFAEINAELTNTAYRNIQLELKILPKEHGELSRITSRFDNHLILEVGFTEDGIRNWMVILEELSRLRILLAPPVHEQRATANLSRIFAKVGIANFEMKGSRGFRHPMILVETQANAELGSLDARKRLAHFETEVLKLASLSLDTFAPFSRAAATNGGRLRRIWSQFLAFLHLRRATRVSIPTSKNPSLQEIQETGREYLRLRNENFQREFTQLDAEHTKSTRTKEREWSTWKEQTRTLDRLESAELKLNDLIKANDRAGVRHLIESYLPWPLMEPVEASAWKKWLEAIEHPDPTKTIVAYRGVDQMDKPQSAIGPDGVERLGFMSTLLTRNQGNYTRRLRSLSTMRQRMGDGNFTDTFTERSPSIINIMSAHSENPVGSPFLSFTPNLEIAEKFVTKDTGGLLVARIDSRRVLPNFASIYTVEAELLVPLVIFPDEVVEYRKGYRAATDRRALMASLVAKDALPEASHVRNVRAAREYYGDGVRDFIQIVADARKGVGRLTQRPTSCQVLFAQ